MALSAAPPYPYTLIHSGGVPSSAPPTLADDTGMKPRVSPPSRNPSAEPADVWVGDRPVGVRRPVYVIAEAGVNHNGEIKLAHRLVEAACEAGANAVKFQVFSADRLAAKTAPACRYQHRRAGAAVSQRRMLQRLELSPAAFRELKRHAERVGLHFLATPFGLEELRYLVSLGVPAIKIASPDVVNIPLLSAAAATGWPLIVSTGAADLSEIDIAVRLINGNAERPKRQYAEMLLARRNRIAEAMRPSGGCATTRLILLHCVSAYPTRPDQARLGCIATLARQFGVPVGFSDHTMSSTFSGLAVAAGAVILEKHMTLDRRMAGPDHFFSLEPAPFRRYVQSAQQAWQALGDGCVRTSAEEREVRCLARGSIIAAKAIRAGRMLRAEHLAIQRPADGIPAAAWSEIIGRVACTDIPADAKLSWDMLR